MGISRSTSTPKEDRFISEHPRTSNMPGDWPKQIGDHRVTTERECADCGASYDCLEQFRNNDCT